ncbi:histidine kinase [Planktothrix sp. FACHB-1365]|uniref:histidine kinase n=1 Tax=Planktothrix sp. FACHB-1365 TaxID=2692855 RepID=UPI00168985F8|nr:histidine kinase [Planktothrix sp. FACHB-1365]MBD2481608.1 histidine kinase [Planktothrix sp. FACHB-1365]
MSDSIQDKLSSDLKKAQSENKLRAERIREIVKSAISEMGSEFKGGSQEIRGLVKEVVGTVLETVKGKGEEIQENVTASIEGVIDGISSKKRQSINKTKAEVKKLEIQLDQEEQELQNSIDLALNDIQEVGTDKSEQIKSAIESAVHNIKDSEEVALMQKRYAQLKAQLAIINANLVGRYGQRYEDIKHYLDEAKVWYEKAKDEPETYSGKLDEKRKAFEVKLGEAGTAIAQKEKQIKQRLRDLWKSFSET